MGYLQHYKRKQHETILDLKRDAITKTTGHTPVMVRIPLKNQTHAITCTCCLSVFTHMNALLDSTCQGASSRAQHLAQKARWWKFARETASDQLGDVVRIWKLSLSEVRFMEKKARNHGLCNVPSLTRQCWFRDLTEEGIHPHPGPSGRPFHGVSLNVNGAERAWQAAQHYLQQKVDFLCLQEVMLTPHKANALMRMAHHHKYHAHFEIGEKRTNAHGQHYWSGGVAVFVPFRHPTRLVATWHCSEAQLVHLDVCNVQLLGVYVRPGCKDPEYIWNHLHETLTSIRGRHWMMLGDWNVTPDENPLASLGHQAQVHAVLDTNGTWEATRWNGSRAIDYALANHWTGRVCFDSSAWADHKAVSFVSNHGFGSGRPPGPCPVSFQKPVQFQCPAGFDPCAWKQALANVWDQCPPPDMEADPETQWVTFNAVAAHAHEQAIELLTKGSCQVVTTTDNLQSHEKARKGCGPKFACFNDTPKACVNFSMRKLRRDLGRLKEAQRQTEQGRFDEAHACCCKVWARRPWLNQVPLTDAIATLNVELLAAEKADRIKSLQKWRDKTRTCTAYRHKWVKDSGIACPIQVKDEQTGRLASHPADVVEVLRQFWSRIWYRAEVSVETAFNAWSAVIGPSDLPDKVPWIPFTAHELAQQAKRMQSSSAGLDGWAGDELACWPTSAWFQYASSANSWFEKGQFPAAWCQLRQVHLPKENVQYKEHCPVEKLRPIVIETALWRVLASAWVRREETQKWVQAWAPIEAFGGIPERSVEDALAKFHTEFKQHSTSAVVSLDLAKCFDHVSAPLALKCLQKLGMPEPMIFACQHVWGQQIRFLQYRGCTSVTPSQVSNSLPQGDALSVIALLAILSMPTLDLRRRAEQDGEHVSMITFIDDRSFLTHNADFAMTMINRWMCWSSDLGLVENHHKICLVAQTAAAKATMLANGAQENWFVPSARILGVDFEYSRSPGLATAIARVNETLCRIKKASFLNVKAKLKLEALAYVALPKATWGCWFFVNLQQWAILQTAINKCMNFWRSPANPALTALLAGHPTQAKMRAILGSISALYRTVAKGHGPQWYLRPKLHTWQQTIAHHLQKLGWMNTGPWTWTHNDCGDIDMSNMQGKDETMHRIRESWRRQLFCKWLTSHRRELQNFPNLVYEEKRIFAVRKAYQQNCVHARAVLTGAAVSDACFKVMCQDDLENYCVHCNDQVIPSWHHACWECAAFSESRPSIPSDEVQKRLGWPLTISRKGNSWFLSREDKQILQHMALVRAQLLSARYD